MESSAFSREALSDLRSARRRRYVQQLEWIDALYRAYLLAISGGLAVALVSGALGDVRVSSQTVADIARDGPASLGLAIALALAAGLRSGGRGGPLAIDAPDVHHVLLSPVGRGTALRGLALRQLRTPVFVGAVFGAIAGNLAFRRLPGAPAQWILCGAAFGAVVALAVRAVAMLASGRRMKPRGSGLVGWALVGWSLGDLLLGARTSPVTMLGALAVWPMHRSQDSFVFAAGGIACALAASCLGLRWLGGTSLESALTRAGLVAQLRFAVTFQDVRTVILLRRQLAGERPRRQPWLSLSSDGARAPVWQRGWRGFLRWPAARVLRFVLLGVVAGLALCGAWQGTTPLVLVAGGAVLVAAFDAIEPLAQEIDHPTRRDLLPVDAASLTRRHLVAPTAAMLAAAPAALAAGVIVSPPALGLGDGLILLLPAVLAAVCAAAFGASSNPYAYVLQPWIGYLQTAVPPALASVGVLPLLAAREAARAGHAAAVAGAEAGLTVLVICGLFVWWLGRRVRSQVPIRRS